MTMYSPHGEERRVSNHASRSEPHPWRRAYGAPQSLTRNGGGYSKSCETSGEELDACDDDPCCGAWDSRLEVFGETAVASEPCKGALDHPAPGLWLEGSDALDSGDDLDRPRAEIGHRLEQLWHSIDAVGEDGAQRGEHPSHGLQQRHRAVIVLDVGGLHENREQRAFGIGDDVSNPRGPPLSVVFTLWLSMMPADGVGFRPTASRANSTSLRLMQCQVPSSRQR